MSTPEPYLTPSNFIPSLPLPKRLALARQHVGIGQEEMAEFLGLSQATVSRYESGAKAPKLQTLRVWALRCGVSFAWLSQPDEDPPAAENSTSGPQELESRWISDRLEDLAEDAA